MLNSVVKLHNGQPLKLYKNGSNSSLETIRPGVKPSSKSVTTIGYGPRPTQLCRKASVNPIGPSRSDIADRPDQQRISKDHQYHTEGPLGHVVTPSDHQRGKYRTKKRSDRTNLQELQDHRTRLFKYVSVILYQVQHRNSSTFYVLE
jgi:hypothetical protein